MINSGKLFKINSKDNVAIVLEDVYKGEVVELDGSYISARDDIPKGHKIALKDIPEGWNIIKYGFPIGHVTRGILTGDHVHIHNLKTNLKGLSEYTYAPELSEESCIDTSEFMGYNRLDGQVGIRNEIWIINTVGCINKTSEILAEKSRRRYSSFNNGIFAFSHPYGCSQLGDDHLNTQKILAGLARHPNAAGVLIVGLGCENNNISEFKKILGDYNSDRVRFLETQGVDDEIEEGLKLIGELVEYAGRFRREKCPSARLIVGLKCGGSDAFSGITANPLVGVFSDMLLSQGGTSILTEIPEMFGAETILMNRCTDLEVFNRTVSLINNFKEYYIRYNQVIYENPSPGNKSGGITTLEEKSLGCIQKGGKGNITDVLEYGSRVSKAGLNLLNGPGNDMVASTALTAAGAHIILFTTGRGTPLGAPVPTIKISSNTDLFTRKKAWIDYDAGQLLNERNSYEIEDEFLKFVLKVASGEIKTKNELNGYKEIAIFKDGVTL